MGSVGDFLFLTISLGLGTACAGAAECLDVPPLSIKSRYQVQFEQVFNA